MSHHPQIRSKTVRYVELVYDLIFVYLLERNNELLSVEQGTFFTPEAFLVYLASTVVILQIWAASVLYINRYGENGAADHIFLFINIYLLFYLGVDTRSDWYGYYISYHVAWGLIFVNLTLQYAIRAHRCKTKAAAESKRFAVSRVWLYAIEAALIFCIIPAYKLGRLPLPWIPLIFAFVAPVYMRRAEEAVPVSGSHLTERVMMFVVLTFGEMIMSIAEYFQAGFTPTSIYYSLMAFLVAAGLLLTYGYLYNHVIDRMHVLNARTYLMLHIVIIVAINNIAVSMDFMNGSEADAFLNYIFLVASFIAFYMFVFPLARHTESVHVGELPFLVPSLIATAAFIAVMFMLYESPGITIAASAVFVFIMLAIVILRWKTALRKAQEQA